MEFLSSCKKGSLPLQNKGALISASLAFLTSHLPEVITPAIIHAVKVSPLSCPSKDTNENRGPILTLPQQHPVQIKETQKILFEAITLPQKSVKKATHPN